MTDPLAIKSLLEKAWSKRRENRYDEAKSLTMRAHNLCEKDDYDNLGRIFHVYMQLESDKGDYTTVSSL